MRVYYGGTDMATHHHWQEDGPRRGLSDGARRGGCVHRADPGGGADRHRRAIGIGVGAFALGSALGAAANPYYGYGYYPYGYYTPPAYYYPPAYGYYPY
jgi:hypothetical protein